MLAHPSAPLGILAFATPALAAKEVVGNEVAGRKLVPKWAVRFRRIEGGRAFAAEDVLALRDRLEMRRVDAASSSAEVIELQFRRHRPDERFVRKAVGITRSAVALEFPVPIVDARSAPQPAAAVGFGRALRPKAIGEALVEKRRHPP
jgi:hypothetical protein